MPFGPCSILTVPGVSEDLGATRSVRSIATDRKQRSRPRRNSCGSAEQPDIDPDKRGRKGRPVAVRKRWPPSWQPP